MDQPLTLAKMHHHFDRLKVQIAKDFQKSINNALFDFKIQLKNEIFQELGFSPDQSANKQSPQLNHQVSTESSSTVSEMQLFELESRITFLQRELEGIPKECSCQQKVKVLETSLERNRETFERKIAELLRRHHGFQIWNHFHAHLKLEEGVINKKCPNIPKFNLIEPLIEIKRNDGNYYQLLGRIPIREKPVNYFSVEKTDKRWILLGIVSEKYLNDANSYCQQRKQCIFYLIEGGAIGRSGKIHGGCKESQEGEVIMMSVYGDKIMWSVDREVRAFLQDQMIADNSIPWVPFIAMQHEGDQVSWQ